jgi:hypothetical protein
VAPGSVTTALAAALQRSTGDVVEVLRERASRHLSRKLERARVFRAVQEAAVELLSEGASDTALRENAQAVRGLCYEDPPLTRGRGGLPIDPVEWLELSTFWTDLRQRPALALHLWPASKHERFAARFREEEIRRELLSSLSRLGLSLIDLYVLLVNALGRVDGGARESGTAAADLSRQFLDLLERQAGEPGLTSFRELSLAAQNLDLIIDTTLPQLRTASLKEVSKELGRVLRNQAPVGGMFGQVNETLVKQFRMPGYPLVMITTDLLQEGEDLHTFCSRVFHYGISWMPSSMEQRAGRVDRVNSAAERRLNRMSGAPPGDAKIQVYFPYLQQTVERLQVEEVLGRMDNFVRMMHEDLTAPQTGAKKIDVSDALTRGGERARSRSDAPLKSAFEIDRKLLGGPKRNLARDRLEAQALKDRFGRLGGTQPPGLTVQWSSSASDGALVGTVHVLERQQPFTLLARSLHGHLVVRCVSPIGRLGDPGRFDELAVTARGHKIRLTTCFHEKFEQYDVAAEGDVVLVEAAHDAALVSDLIRRVTAAADQLERELLGTDEPLASFEDNMKEELHVAR